jgi:uncharacterized protein with von Willebrand factor type A (vWA) domain
MLELDLPALAGAFGRRLHDGGVAMTPARCADLARALALVAPITRRRLYWTARTVAVSEPAQVRAFDAVFFSVFGSRADGREFEPPQASSAAAPADQRAPSVRDRPPPASDADEARASVSLSRAGGRDADDQAPELEVPLAMASDEELLRARSFDALEPEELAQLHRLMSLLAVETPLRRLRRHEKGRHGEQIDLRRTLRGSLRTGGDPIRLARRRRRIARRRLVMLCDISGSMEPYARAYLQFLACAAAGGRDTEAFVFATRLTRVTRALAARSHERAIARAAAAAPDWSSGTRIGDALKTFNDRHGRRGMARGAVVVILSDGWERGDPALVAREMERLGRLAHRIVWVNPRAGASSFSVAAGGMVAALPHCDALVSGHSFEALGEVVAAIGASSRSSRGGPAAGWKPGAAAEIEVPEPWASATPVPGSSVAMPSGHGPKRGVTTPGWTNERGE